MPVATLNYGDAPHTGSNASFHQHQRQAYTTTIPPREFLVQVEIWSPGSTSSTSATGNSSKSKANKSSKSSKSRPGSSIFTASGSGVSGSGSGLSQDDVSMHSHSLHPVVSNTDAFSINSGLTSNTTYSGYSATGGASVYSTSSKKSGLSTLFGGKTDRSSSGGSWRPAICKLSGEGGYGGYNGMNGGSSGQALLTIYSSEDNTLQHVINVHKLTSTDVRAVDKSLFVRQDVLGVFTHPSAISLSTISSTSHSTLAGSNPNLLNVNGGTAGTVDPIYLAFPSTDAHNTWLVLLRSYTSPEVYGRMINPEQGGLYRMWRQIELVVMQSKGSLTVPTNSSATAPGGGTATNAAGPQTASYASHGHGHGTAGAGNTNGASGTGAGGGNGGRPPMERTVSSGTNGSTMNGAEVGIPLGLTKSHTPSINTAITNITSITSATSTTTASSETGMSSVSGMSPSNTSIAGGAATSSLKSYSTSSLPSTNTADSGENTPMGGTSTPRPTASNSNANANTTSTASASVSAKEKEKREKKERERIEKERKNLLKAPGMFCEVILDGDICARTTVKRSPLSSLNSPSTYNNNSGVNGEWTENFLFGDLPSFGTLVVTLWRAPETSSSSNSGSSSKKDKDDGRPKSAGRGTNSTQSTISTGTNTSNSGNAGTTSSTGFTTSTTSIPTSTASHLGVSSSSLGLNLGMSGNGTYTDPNILAAGGSGLGGLAGGGIKGATYLGTVEIALPNFRRGEWVEGWWPVYANANANANGANKDNSLNGLNALNSMGMGTAAMGLGGMSGIGGVSGALVQIGELRLKIKVCEEIILPSRAYKNVLDSLEQRNYLDILSDLEQKLRIDPAMITPHIVSLAVARNRLLKDIVKLAEREVMNLAGSTSTLFRNNTVLTKTMELTMSWYGRAFLDASVGPVIRRMIAENVEIEIDPNRLHVPGSSKRPSTKDSSYRPTTRESFRPSSAGGIMINGSSTKDRFESERDALQEQGLRSLEYWCGELWNQLYNVRMECPVELRRLFGHIRALVEARFGAARQAHLSTDPMHPNPSLTNPANPANANATGTSSSAEMLPWQAISGFVFLRFIVPPLLNPHLFGICPGMPPEGVRRSLTLLAKCTQSLANLNPGAAPKEEYMRGIRNLLERNMETMIDYLACVSTLPDQFSPSANASSFLSGPDKHDRLHVINSLRERLTGTGGNSIPTLYKDAIPLLPYALDVPKHLAILSSAVVRNARTGNGATYNNSRGGTAGANGDEPDPAWTLSKFSELCFDVEAQALKSVATLAQGAASAGAFGSRPKPRSGSLSSYQQSGSTLQQSQQQTQGQGQSQSSPLSPISASVSSSRGVTPTAGVNGSGNISATTPTQMPTSPWTSRESRRPGSAKSARSVRDITTPTAANVAASTGNHNGSPTSNGSSHSGSPRHSHNQGQGVAFPVTPSPPFASEHSLRREGADSPAPAHAPSPAPAPAPAKTQTITVSHPFSSKKKKSSRPSTAPSATSTPIFPPYEHPSSSQRQLAIGRPIVPSGRSERSEKRPEDLTVPDTPTSTKSAATSGSASSQRFGYSAESAGGYAISTDEELRQRQPTTHRLGSETYIAFHYPTSSNSPSRHQPPGPSIGSPMNPMNSQPSQSRSTTDRQKGERSSSTTSGRPRDFMKRPSTASGPTTPARATQFPFNDPESDLSPTSPSGFAYGQGRSTPGDEIARLREWRAMEEIRLREWRNGQPDIASPASARPGSSGRRSFGNSSGGAGSGSGRGSGDAQVPPPSASKRSEGAGSGSGSGSGGSSGPEGKKKRGFFGWLKK